MQNEKKEVRVKTDDPNITGVIRWKNGGIQHLKEIRQTTGESAPVNGVTTEIITITRQIGLETNDFPT